MLESIRFNLTGLLRFRGRESRAMFWPYALVVIAFAMISIEVATMPMIADSMQRMERFAATHPEMATIRSEPGAYSISIEGDHPELVPDFTGMIRAIAWSVLCAIILLAAAVTRRLRDRGRRGWIALPPVLLLTSALLLMPRAIAMAGGPLLFFALFLNNCLYLASLIYLIVELARPGAEPRN